MTALLSYGDTHKYQSHQLSSGFGPFLALWVGWLAAAVDIIWKKNSLEDVSFKFETFFVRRDRLLRSS